MHLAESKQCDHWLKSIEGSYLASFKRAETQQFDFRSANSWWPEKAVPKTLKMLRNDN